ncbi:MAG TPA: aromatic amino acid transport family protein [Gammaproteobacteria bacterium]|nr:aromatic amino acid transport family protein [Gammaproteobacteria bacterium]
MTTRKMPSLIGGILLVIGNVIGAGILALPIAIAQLGWPVAMLTLVVFWLLMMVGAFYFLEANLALPKGSNLISMSKAALGKPGVIVAWGCYLLVMYSLIAAYLSGGGDLVKINFQYLGITLPSWSSSILFLLIFGFIVTRGIHVTDHTNRVLMLSKAVIFFTAVLGIASHFDPHTLFLIPQKSVSASLLVVTITSFGFATLIPSLRSYYQDDVVRLKKIIFWGTLIPLLCYMLWSTVIFSVVPYEGSYGLSHMAHSTHPVSDLQAALSQALHRPWITQATNIFSAICIITSFLANSISLTDFIHDGIQPSDKHRKSWIVYTLAWLPALLAVLFYQKAFLMGLSIAGTLAIVQLLVLPMVIVWRFRDARKNKSVPYTVPGGKMLLAFLIFISVMFFFLTFIL